MSAGLLCLWSLLPGPLVDRLSERQFRARESAQRGLSWLGPLAVPALLAAAESHPDFETSRRCRLLLAPYWEGICDHRSRRMRPLPYIDRDVLCRGPGVPDALYYHYYWLARANVGEGRCGSPLWLEYREGTRLLVRDLLLRGESHARVLHLLGRLAAAEHDHHFPRR